MNKASSKKDICIERVKYLMTYKYKDILEDDKINRILIKIVLDQIEYSLLENWHLKKWDIKKTAESTRKTKKECEEDINKIIDKLVPILWNYKNNPFVNDMSRKSLISKQVWIGDKIIEEFLGIDLMIIPVDEYIDTFLERGNA